VIIQFGNQYIIDIKNYIPYASPYKKVLIKRVLKKMSNAKILSQKRTSIGNKASIHVSNAILFVLSILIAMVVGEIALRAVVNFKYLPRNRGFASFVLQRDVRRIYVRGAYDGNDLGLFRETPNSKLRWEPVPGAHAGTIRINAGGFRGPDVYFLPVQGITRIAVLGDSQAFGMNLVEADTLAGALEHKLNATSRKGKFEVLNFGVPGYNTQQEMLAFRQKVLPYHPSVIVLYYSLNDPEIPDSTVFLGSGPLSSSYLYMLAVYYFKVHSSMADLRRESRDLVDYYIHLYGSAYFIRCTELIRQMAAESQSHGARFYLVIAPEVNGFEHFANYPYEAIHARLRDLESGPLRVIDPLASFRSAYDSPLPLWAKDYDAHLNAVATSLVADLAAKRILSETITQ
jgi:hypothetical protein